MIPANNPQNILRRVHRAEKFPFNTDPCSRHVREMAEGLLRGGYPMLTWEPEHCAVSMLAVLESLYKLRTKLAKLEAAQGTK